MWASIRKFIAPPIYPANEEKTRKARYLNTILLASILLLSIFLPFIAGSDYISTESFFGPSTAVITFLLIVMVGLFIWMRFGFITQASFTLVILTWLALTAARFLRGRYSRYDLYGLHRCNPAGRSFAGYSLQHRRRHSQRSCRLGYCVTWKPAGLFVPRIDTAYNMARDFTVFFVLIGVLTYITVSGLQNAIGRLERQTQVNWRKATRNYGDSNQPRRTGGTAHQRACTNNRTDRTTRQAASNSSRCRASHSICPGSGNIITDHFESDQRKFGFYHTGIFLNDERGEYAVLKAANSEGGKRMLDRSHALKIGEQGIVGYVAKHGLTANCSGYRQGRCLLQ